MDVRNMMDENSPPVKCSKPGCKRFVTNSQFKRCDPCRNRQAGIVKQGRQRRKAAEKESTLHGSKGRKRVQEDTNSSEERPTQRARPDNSGLAAENPHTIADDDDDDNIDGLPFWGLDKKVSCCFMRVSDKYTDIPLR
jgi:hypothetical protein